MAVPLSILDLSPVKSGGTPGEALRETLDLARRAEEFGYLRYWLAEHHLAPGVAGSAPQVMIAMVAAATSRIRVGSGAVQTGHWTALAVAEQFATIDALFPGRIDLGLGRSGRRRRELAGAAPAPPATGARVVDGLLLPAPFDPSVLAGAPVLQLFGALLQQPGAESPDFAEQVDDIIALLDGGFTRNGIPARIVPGEDSDLAVWILGSSGGESARVAGERGLPFAANYHVAPSHVLEAVEAYRAAFKPSEILDEPHVIVSADVVVAPTDEEARVLAAPYPLWVRSIRRELQAIPYPTPAQAAEHHWTDQDRALVEDRVATQFVGAPSTVVERLETLRRVTAADELLITTITHAHEDRIRSYELLSHAWNDLTA